MIHLWLKLSIAIEADMIVCTYVCAGRFRELKAFVILFLTARQGSCSHLRAAMIAVGKRSCCRISTAVTRICLEI